MKLGQSQDDAGFLGYSVEEKPVKIGCKKKEKKEESCIRFVGLSQRWWIEWMDGWMDG